MAARKPAPLRSAGSVLDFIHGAGRDATPAGTVIGGIPAQPESQESPASAPKEARTTPDTTEPKKTAPGPANQAAGPWAGQGAPWKDANPRVKVPFTARLPEPLHARLRWLAENTAGTSMHAIALQALEREVARRLREQGIDPKG